jgi:hypothetical protein
LSHFTVDEEIDNLALKGLTEADGDVLSTLPRYKLQSATTEILNWVAAAGAMGDTKMELLTYQPAYRSPAGTGCGCAVARWTPSNGSWAVPLTAVCVGPGRGWAGFAQPDRYAAMPYEVSGSREWGRSAWPGTTQRRRLSTRRTAHIRATRLDGSWVFDQSRRSTGRTDDSPVVRQPARRGGLRWPTNACRCTLLLFGDDPAARADALHRSTVTGQQWPGRAAADGWQRTTRSADDLGRVRVFRRSGLRGVGGLADGARL